MTPNTITKATPSTDQQSRAGNSEFPADVSAQERRGQRYAQWRASRISRSRRRKAEALTISMVCSGENRTPSNFPS
jgi:hypothetical protein